MSLSFDPLHELSARNLPCATKPGGSRRLPFRPLALLQLLWVHPKVAFPDLAYEPRLGVCGGVVIC